MEQPLAIEIRLAVIEKDIEIIKLQVGEFKDYSKKTDQLLFLMSSLQEKIEQLLAAHGYGLPDDNDEKDWRNMALEFVKYFGWIILIGAAILGVKVF